MNPWDDDDDWWQAYDEYAKDYENYDDLPDVPEALK